MMLWMIDVIGVINGSVVICKSIGQMFNTPYIFGGIRWLNFHEKI
jgi:hypothetical protein